MSSVAACSYALVWNFVQIKWYQGEGRWELFGKCVDGGPVLYVIEVTCEGGVGVVLSWLPLRLCPEEMSSQRWGGRVILDAWWLGGGHCRQQSLLGSGHCLWYVFVASAEHQGPKVQAWVVKCVCIPNNNEGVLWEIQASPPMAHSIHSLTSSFVSELTESPVTKAAMRER